ncbi:hypothetical protein [Streptomyces sp. SID13031]|uniref:hypothetical protein n=1 Tax=Streptomyces sp. SID13031 TaxID=2706046 RepID=UPI0013CC8F4F|nr:hypothetical protein [Streptomyces sp. SID13031]NEA30706.1 hypothetical protein [Streptomyces sp. SID13031]
MAHLVEVDLAQGGGEPAVPLAAVASLDLVQRERPVLGLGVAGQQQASAADGDEQDDAGVVEDIVECLDDLEPLRDAVLAEIAQ